LAGEIRLEQVKDDRKTFNKLPRNQWKLIESKGDSRIYGCRSKQAGTWMRMAVPSKMTPEEFKVKVREAQIALMGREIGPKMKAVPEKVKPAPTTVATRTKPEKKKPVAPAKKAAESYEPDFSEKERRLIAMIDGKKRKVKAIVSRLGETPLRKGRKKPLKKDRYKKFKDDIIIIIDLSGLGIGKIAYLVNREEFIKNSLDKTRKKMMKKLMYGIEGFSYNYDARNMASKAIWKVISSRQGELEAERDRINRAKAAGKELGKVKTITMWIGPKGKAVSAKKPHVLDVELEKGGKIIPLKIKLYYSKAYLTKGLIKEFAKLLKKKPEDIHGVGTYIAGRGGVADRIKMKWFEEDVRKKLPAILMEQGAPEKLAGELADNASKYAVKDLVERDLKGLKGIFPVTRMGE